MQLRMLLDALKSAGRLVPGEARAAVLSPACEEAGALQVTHLADDSRQVEPGALFVAVRGADADGHDYVGDAVRRGARVVVSEAVPAEAADRFPRVTFVQVSDGRLAAAELAAAFYEHPARALTMVGITGTNGKTTTTGLVHHVLQRLRGPAGLIGTIAVQVGNDAVEAATLTTPGPVTLQRTLRQMVDHGCTSCTMEVSSHALVQGRVHAVEYDAAVFTNLTPEHLDYHGTLDAYRAAKKILFDGLGAKATALYNADDEHGTAIIRDTVARTCSFGQSDDADVRFAVLDSTLHGLRLLLDGREAAFRLVGLFNAYNLVAAYGVGRALGCGAAEVIEALAEAPPVPGRFEQMAFDGGTTVVVDYAHTPDALENVLHTARALRPEGAALWCVFGCGGDRDRIKRPVMGALAEHYADRVVVTSDNPRTEDPLAIMDDIRVGMDRPDDALWVADRREAIGEVARRCRPGDAVVVAGKGHETYQAVGHERRPFDDREEVRKAFGEKDETNRRTNETTRRG